MTAYSYEMNWVEVVRWLGIVMLCVAAIRWAIFGKSRKSVIEAVEFALFGCAMILFPFMPEDRPYPLLILSVGTLVLAIGLRVTTRKWVNDDNTEF